MCKGQYVNGRENIRDHSSRPFLSTCRLGFVFLLLLNAGKCGVKREAGAEGLAYDDVPDIRRGDDYV